jgi:large subunit ribosomal protein L21
MFAIIRSGARQYKAEPNRVIEVNRLPLEKGAEFTSDQVLFVGGEEAKARIGAPYVKGARVTGVVVEHLRGKKIITYKLKRRKNYRRTRGHRQELTRVRIEKIEVA